MQRQVNTACVVGHLNQAVPISAGSIKSRAVWHCPDGRRFPSGHFSLIASFKWSNLEQYLSEFNVRFCRRISQYIKPFNTRGYTASPSSYANQLWAWLTVIYFFFTRNFSAPRCCKQFRYHHTWLFFSKIGCFVAFEKEFADGNAIHSLFSNIVAFTYPSGFKNLRMLIWDMWSIPAMFRVVWPVLLLISFSIWSSFKPSGLSDCRWFPDQNIYF